MSLALIDLFCLFVHPSDCQATVIFLHPCLDITVFCPLTYHAHAQLRLPLSGFRAALCYCGSVFTLHVALSLYGIDILICPCAWLNCMSLLSICLSGIILVLPQYNLSFFSDYCILLLYFSPIQQEQAFSQPVNE